MWHGNGNLRDSNLFSIVLIFNICCCVFFIFKVIQFKEYVKLCAVDFIVWHAYIGDLYSKLSLVFRTNASKLSARQRC